MLVLLRFFWNVADDLQTFNHCTQELGPLRQNLFSCITCNPPPESSSEPYSPAGVCYACSIACHGDHTLVELFSRRNFTCDCGTTRLPATSPCTLRIDPVTGFKGSVHSQRPSEGNTYNQNFRNRFCGCGDWYNAHEQKSTMYQCLGLATEVEGGCGEDWWHPECLLGLPHDWQALTEDSSEAKKPTEVPSSIVQNEDEDEDEEEEEEDPIPPGFPKGKQIETLICYKCTNVHPWIKQYAGSKGFLPPLFYKPIIQLENETAYEGNAKISPVVSESKQTLDDAGQSAKKRKLDDDDEEHAMLPSSKKTKVEPTDLDVMPEKPGTCQKKNLPPSPEGVMSLIACDEDFRSKLCRCPECYLDLRKHPQLLEEEEVYEPPRSEDGENEEGGGSVGTGSLLDRGEAALSNVDRVRAIGKVSRTQLGKGNSNKICSTEGVMVYNHLKEKVKSFLQPFAESGQAVGAEDIKAYFEKLRGDAEAIRAAGGAALMGGDGPDDDNRKEQSGMPHNIDAIDDRLTFIGY